jgi:hypothetical protein
VAATPIPTSRRPRPCPGSRQSVKTIAKPSLAPPWISQTPRPDSQRQDRAVQACAGRAVRQIDPSRQRARNGARVRAKHELPTARLIDRRDLTPDLMVIRLEPEARYTFAPGQSGTVLYDWTRGDRTSLLDRLVAARAHPGALRGARSARHAHSAALALAARRLALTPGSPKGRLHAAGAVPLAPDMTAYLTRTARCH